MTQFVCSCCGKLTRLYWSDFKAGASCSCGHKYVELNKLDDLSIDALKRLVFQMLVWIDQLDDEVDSLSKTEEDYL